MNIFKTLDFTKWQKKSGITDIALAEATLEMKSGLVEANLGGNVYKKRIAKKGLGKRASYRTIVATKNKGVWIFLYGFEKNQQSNINKQDLDTLQEFAKELLSLPLEILNKSKIINKVIK